MQWVVLIDAIAALAAKAPELAGDVKQIIDLFTSHDAPEVAAHASATSAALAPEESAA